ncbi:MAG: hypothetical protein N3A01_06950 [Bacteroidales bacterium]|nr:hypothetical protein [Bacteroidales bacterium]
MSFKLLNKNFILIVILSFIFYGNTILNNYAVDDIVVITKNSYTQQGIKGIPKILTNSMFAGFYGEKKDFLIGGRYRPFSQITFAIEHEIFGNNPHVNHFFNVFYFAILNVVLFILLSKFSNHNVSWYKSVPLIATLLYIAHPIHTEVVANIKGRDEIFALLFSLLTMLFFLKSIKTSKATYNFLVFVFFLIALLSKEISLVFLFIIPFSIIYFDLGNTKTVLKKITPLLGATIIYLILRHIALSDIKKLEGYVSDSFIEMDVYQKYFTIIYIIFLYLKLLFVPHPLTVDYYPNNITPVNYHEFRFIISLFTILSVFIIALISFKKNKIVFFSIVLFFAFIIPVSNIFFPIGSFMNERFLFVPSVGFCLTMAHFYVNYFYNKIKHIFANSLLIAIIIVYFIITITRNFQWKDNYTLLSHDIKVSPNSAWGNYSFGYTLLEKAEKLSDSLIRAQLLQKSIYHLKKATEISPTSIESYFMLAGAYYYYNKNFDSIVWAYKKILLIDNNNNDVYKNLEAMLASCKNTDFILKTYQDLFNINPNRFEVNHMLGFLYGKYKNDINKSLFFLNRAYKLKNNDIQVLKDLGVAYAIAGNYDSSLYFLFKALNADTNDAQLYLNIAVTYYHKKSYDLALKYYNFAKKKNSKIFLENFEKLFIK